MTVRDSLAGAVASVRHALGRVFKDPEELELTEGSIGWPLFFLSLPIVVTNLLQTAYNLADTFWLGQLSKEALAAITYAFPMVFLLISLGMGLTVAGSILVAQHTGAEDKRGAEFAASQTVTFAILASLLLGAFGYFVVEDLLRLIGASQETLPMAAGYMRVVSLGLVFMFGFFVFVSLMRGYGDTVTPMLVMFGTVVVNIALDPFLIFGWGPFPALGVQGAAVATVFSRALAMVVGLWIMLAAERGVTIHLHSLWPDLGYFRKLVRLGAPASVEGTGRAVSVNLMLVVVAMFPDTVVAAFGIGVRVFSVIFLPAIAIGRGVETLTGQNIGAENEGRAARTNDFAAIVMFVVLSAAAVVVWVGAPAIVDVFTTDPDVVPIGAEFVRLVAPSFGFIGVMRAYNGGFRGAGRTMTAAAIAIVTLGVVRLPIAWFGSQAFGTTGLFASFVVSNVVGAVLAAVWFRQGTWKGGDVRGEAPAMEDVDLPQQDAAVDD